MVFNSLEFAIFLCVVLGLYYSLRHDWQNRLLLVASWFFYGWWDYRFLVLLLISSIVDFFCGIRIHQAASVSVRRWYLTLSLASNLGILGFFKYFNFFAESTIESLTWLGLEANPWLLDIVLPMGISFYTFQTMAYSIDVYRDELEPCRSFVDFALYVSYFPQLVAGPIERATRLLPQIESKRTVGVRDVQEGGALILLGLFKKVGVADALAPHLEPSFQFPTAASGLSLLVSIYLPMFGALSQVGNG